MFGTTTPEKDLFAVTFTRHLTPLCLTYSFEGKSYASVITAFLLELRGYAFIISAGHIRADLEQVLEDSRYSNQRFSVLDGGAREPVDHHPIPLDVDYVRQNMCFVDWNGYDYAFLAVRQHYYDLFTANGIVPLDEHFWQKDNPPGNSFAMVGIPAQWNITSDPRKLIEFYFCIKTFSGLKEKPEGMDPKPEGTIFGEIPMDDSLTDIGGMSGGPVFSVNVNNQGKMIDYKLVGVQSIWREKRYIAAPPVAVLIEMIWQKTYKKAAVGA